MTIFWMIFFLAIFVGGFIYFACLAASKEKGKIEE
ncbi:MAG: hypothetical protein K0Q65_1541 [Clostridia bacterium]|jgi:hypothetical protein|nr:hypothetical protein [Clostridia bacterium]